MSATFRWTWPMSTRGSIASELTAERYGQDNCRRSSVCQNHEAVDVTRGPDPAETIGHRLRRLRLERGLSQRELAGPGVSYAYISRIEAGARQPSVKALRKLAQKLGVSTDYLETGSEVRADELRELRLSEAELKLRLEQHPAASAEEFAALLEESRDAGDAQGVLRARLGLGEAAARRGDYGDAVGQLETRSRRKRSRR